MCKPNNILLVLGLMALMAAPALADSLDWDRRLSHRPGGPQFAEQEFSVDLFAINGSRERDTFIDNDAFGVGIGANYFITRYLGFSADSYIDEFDLPNHLDLSAVLRLPCDQWSVAPYLFGGVGRQFHDAVQWTSHLGGGAEYRLNPQTGIFLDIRRVFADETDDLNVWRLGLRLKF